VEALMRAFLLLAAVVLSSAAFGPLAQDNGFKLSDEERKLIDLTNSERRKQKVTALQVNPVLCAVARAHAANMAKQGKMEHELDGKSTYDRIKGAGYRYSLAGENLARGDVSFEEVMAAWMRSRVHRENILEADFTEIGIGLVKDDKGDTYYAQVFAAPHK
jgi:uncharacterized protein YkwD